MSGVSAIVVAAGSGSRLKSKVSKPLVKVCGKPAIVYSLKVLSRHKDIREIVVVGNKQNSPGIEAVIRAYRIKRSPRVVLGGRRRQDSVENGLAATSAGTGLVLIHDAARPFITAHIVSGTIRAARKNGAAVAGIKVSATIKKVSASGAVVRTIPRDALWEIQTPQVFRKDLLKKAYKRFGRACVTDEAALIEKMKRRVKVVPGSPANIKITSPEDLRIAEVIAKWNIA